MAPLQKRAWWGLGVGLALAVAFALVFTLMGGIDTFDKDRNFRIIVDVLWIGSLIANLITVNPGLRKTAPVDERDRLIIDRAPRVQWLAVVFTLAAWVVALTEVYHATNLMPTVYLYIMFMSVLIVSTLAQSLGILVGYWRMDRGG